MWFVSLILLGLAAACCGQTVRLVAMGSAAANDAGLMALCTTVLTGCFVWSAIEYEVNKLKRP